MQQSDRPAHTAGIFDIRNIIGALIGIYGVVLLVTGVVGTSSAEVDRSAGVNANLWAGGGMLLVGILFVVWAQLRPTVVDDVEEDSGERRSAGSQDR